MADKPTASEILGRYYKALEMQGIDGDLREAIVLDSAQKLHAGEFAPFDKDRTAEQAHG